MYINGKDTVRGTDATVTMEIGDRIIDLFQVKNFESNANITIDEVPRIGTRTVGHKVSTITFEGSFTAYHGSPEARTLLIKYYMKYGDWPEITITTRVEDKDTHIGALTVVHKHVRFSNLPLARVDAETTSLEEDFDFTCDEVLVPEEYNNLDGAVINVGTIYDAA